MNIVFLVAGLSTRYGGTLKQMAIINSKNETLIEYSVNQALNDKTNFTKLIFITNPKTEQLYVDIFGENYKNTPVEYIQQTFDPTRRKKPWELLMRYAAC